MMLTFFRAFCLKAEFYLLLITIIWGSTFVVIPDSLERHWSPMMLTTVRFALASLVLLPWLSPRLWSKEAVMAGLALGFAAFLGFGLQTESLLYTNSNHAAFATAFSPILVGAFELISPKKRFLGTYLAVVLGSIGLFLLFDTPAEASVEKGDILALSCAVAFAVQILLLSHFLRRYPWQPLVIVQNSSCTLFCLLTAFAFDEVILPVYSVAVWWGPVYLGCIATGLTLGLQAIGQKEVGSSRAAFIYALEPVVAACLAALFLGQWMGGIETIGGSLIVLASLFAERSLSFFRERYHFLKKRIFS